MNTWKNLFIQQAWRRLFQQTKNSLIYVRSLKHHPSLKYILEQDKKSKFRKTV